jgi:iron complex outermembrane receptor protein
VNIQRALLSGASALAVYAALSCPSFAQTSTAPNTSTTPAPSAQGNSDGIETVTVTGIRGSLRDSLKLKENSDLITENISAKDIGQLPDITIAEELNTLPGVNATRDRGNDSQINVRGLGPRLVLGLVNGEEIASSEPDQDIRWEIFPSEIVSGVQVFKTQSADIISGGIAGVVNIQTIQPLDYTGPTFTVRAGPTYNEEANSLPNYSPWGSRERCVGRQAHQQLRRRGRRKLPAREERLFVVSGLGLQSGQSRERADSLSLRMYGRMHGHLHFRAMGCADGAF